MCLKAPDSPHSPRASWHWNPAYDPRIRDRGRLHNHFGTVHAIALGNMAELSAGVMTGISVPPEMRRIPKGMHVAWLKKVVGTLHIVASGVVPARQAATGYEWPVAVHINDANGQAVFGATEPTWVPPRSRG